MRLYFHQILLDIIMKKLIAVLITFGISLAANANSSNQSHKEGLQTTNILEFQPVNLSAHRKHHMGNQRHNHKKVNRTYPCGNETMKPKFSKSFRPR